MKSLSFCIILSLLFFFSCTFEQHQAEAVMTQYMTSTKNGEATAATPLFSKATIFYCQQVFDMSQNTDVKAIEEYLVEANFPYLEIEWIREFRELQAQEKNLGFNDFLTLVARRYGEIDQLVFENFEPIDVTLLNHQTTTMTFHNPEQPTNVRTYFITKEANHQWKVDLVKSWRLQNRAMSNAVKDQQRYFARKLAVL